MKVEVDPLCVVRVAADRVVLVPLARADAVEDNLFVLEEPQVWARIIAGQTDGLEALIQECVEKQILRLV